MNNTRVALYVRVSTQEQTKGYSIGEQIDRLTKYSEAHGWITTKIYNDAGYSGANMNRPALQELIEDVKAGRLDKVVVYKLDRLSRSQKDTLKIIEDILLSNDCDFESMTERFDTSTSFGKAMVGILAVFAQLEREQIKERMMMGTTARIKEGKWRGGAHVPFGYRYNHDKNILVIDDYEAMIVKYIFDQFTSGHTMHWIRYDMTAKGYRINGNVDNINGNVDGRRIDYILKNKTYCGFQLYNGTWYPAGHEAIIDEQTYEKAQEIMTRKHTKNGIEPVSTHLGGIVFCARCGARYSKYTTGNKKSGIHVNYGCYSRHKKVKYMIKDPACKNKSYRVEELDRIVFDEIKKLVIDPNYISMVRDATESTDSTRQIHIIEKQIHAIKNQLSRLMDLYSTGIFDISDIEEKTKPLMKQRDNLQNELNRIRTEPHVTQQQVSEMVTSFQEALEHGTMQERRMIIEQLISRIDIDGDDITIHWNFT